MSKFWNFKAINSGTAELMLYGPISEDSWWGDEVTPKNFAEDLKALGDIEELHIRINSGGGDVFAANAIYNLIKAKKCTKKVYVDGLAASAASVIAMVGDQIIMPGNAMMMIHDPWVYTGGNSTKLTGMIELLEKVKDTILFTYTEKTKKDKDEIAKMMTEETWMTGEEAVAMGFADVLSDSVSVAASVIHNSNGSSMVFNGVSVNMENFQNRAALKDKLKNLVPKKGEDVMTLEQILNKLSEEEQNLIKNEMTKLSTTSQNSVDSEEITKLQDEVTALKNQLAEVENQAKPNTEEDILNSVDPKIKDMIETARKNEAAAQAALQKIKDDQEVKQFQNLAASFDKLPISAEEFGPVLKNFAAADKEGFEKLQELLKAVNNSVEVGTLFKNAGVAGDINTGSAWDQIQAKMKVLMEADTKLDKADAMVQVMKSEPALYNLYRQEMLKDPSADAE